MEIEGRTALLTGATGGLGRAIAHSLSSRGAQLILSGRNQADLETLAAGLPGEGHRAIAADLTAEGAGLGLLSEAGPVDILVANAGIPGTGAVEEAEAAAIERVLKVNLEVPMVMSAAALAEMRKRGSGHVVLIASLAGKAIPTNSALYSATKAGLRAFGRGIRDDHAGTAVSASVVSPGFVRDAGMFADSGAKPPPGLGTATPEEVGEAVAEAIEDDAAEVDVAPVVQRRLANFAFHFHGAAARLERAMGGQKTAEQMAAGRSKD